VATAGDVNWDGYSDVIVGAPFYYNGQTDEGRVYVYHGSGAGLSAAPGWTAESDQADAGFGLSVATAGDVNGDGYGDVVVGAPYYANGQTDEGRACVYHGSAAGLSTAPGWTAESDQAEAGFGFSAATAGDVNGDGYGDVIVGAPYYDNGQSNEGRACVYHGSAAGLSAAPGWTAESEQPDAGFGLSVATAGDANDDGYSDMIVGALDYDNGESDEGRACVYHGSAGSPSGVEPPLDDPALFELRAAGPNPARQACSVRLVLGHPGRLRVEVLDASGRRVADLVEDEFYPVGSYVLTWDGRTRSGERAAAGVYLVHARVDGEARVRKRVIVP